MSWEYAYYLVHHQAKHACPIVFTVHYDDLMCFEEFFPQYAELTITWSELNLHASSLHFFEYSVGSCQVTENVSRHRCFYIQQQGQFSELQRQMCVTPVTEYTE